MLHFISSSTASTTYSTDGISSFISNKFVFVHTCMYVLFARREAQAKKKNYPLLVLASHLTQLISVVLKINFENVRYYW